MWRLAKSVLERAREVGVAQLDEGAEIRDKYGPAEVVVNIVKNIADLP
jgi:hypothetical protein